MAVSAPKMSTLKASAAPVEASGDPSQAWQRVEIEPGLELHVRSDYTAGNECEK